MTLSLALHLNAFRGVRAISEFDWPFTPTHRSSKNFSTFTGSALHPETIGTSACPWVDHPVSRLPLLAIRPVQARFRFASVPEALKLANKEQLVGSLCKRHAVIPSQVTGLRPLVSTRFQVLFTPFLRVLFTFPSRYWFAIGLSGVFSLGGWSPRVQAGFHVSRPTRFTSIMLACTRLSLSAACLSRAVPLAL